MSIVPIEFLIENPTDYFLDLRQSYLNIKFKVVNSNGSNLAANAKKGLVNYPIASLFQQVNVLLNGNLISSSTNAYAYRAMLEVLLGYHQGAKQLIPYYGTLQQRHKNKNRFTGCGWC